MTALAGAATDMYTPALPAVVRDLRTSAPVVQGTVGVFLAALAVGQLVMGSLSDGLGRRRPLLLSLTAFVVTSLLCAVSTSAATLLAARAGQGLAASGGVVLARSIVQDVAGDDAARGYTRLAMVTGLAPVLAPVAGAGVLEVLGWRWIFVAQALVGLGVLGWAALGQPETLSTVDRRSPGLRGAATSYRRLLADRDFARYAAVYGLSAGVVFAYIGSYSFVVIDDFDASPTVYAVLFAANALGMVAFGGVNRMLLHVREVRSIVRSGLLVSAVSAAAMLTSILADSGLAVVAVAMWAIMAVRSFIMPNTAGLAMARSRRSGGSASALIGTAQWAVGGFAILAVGLVPLPRGPAMAGAILAFSAGAWLLVGRGPAGRVR
jgi:DHA1 family bicyclomycin/chloramphenicol resistance-like MFS transporter